MKKPVIESRKEVTRTYTQTLNGSVERVFPLLCPVRELEWVPGWPLLSVRSNSGVAEKNCIFTTETENGQAVWVITEYDPGENFVEMLRIDPRQTVCKLQIQLRSSGDDTCTATVTYAHSAITKEGEAFVENFTDEYYKTFMVSWESELNRFLGAAEDQRSEVRQIS